MFVWNWLERFAQVWGVDMIFGIGGNGFGGVRSISQGLNRLRKNSVFLLRSVFLGDFFVDFGCFLLRFC